jgi:hypothetical protein
MFLSRSLSPASPLSLVPLLSSPLLPSSPSLLLLLLLHHPPRLAGDLLFSSCPRSSHCRPGCASTSIYRTNWVGALPHERRDRQSALPQPPPPPPRRSILLLPPPTLPLLPPALQIFCRPSIVCADLVPAFANCCRSHRPIISPPIIHTSEYEKPSFHRRDSIIPKEL